jgi:hypothetical protein
MEKACDSWKIDPKDYKICRNCKKPKAEHQTNNDNFTKSKSVGNNESNPTEKFANEKLPCKTIKEESENTEKKGESEKEKSVSFQEKKLLFQKSNEPNLNDVNHKNFVDSTKKNSDIKEKEAEKKAVEDLTSSSSSEDSESAKEKQPITKNFGFKNKLEGLFAKGGNPMRMNDDLSFAPIKKNNLNILANGKRASRTYGGS